ncbi:hypothetical protein BJP25_09760 [Actinokineospora bangkokensis]|uniref:DUF8017 domain-containing protein n=1 Tax=Actinokineospora bangkokensis TaxID=1193682 RepID=A0A1Q9LQ00_9PSEU|nr:hypothetical protein BJP25_09760 [Actinokineospora bangkokensis]
MDPNTGQPVPYQQPGYPQGGYPQQQGGYQGFGMYQQPPGQPPRKSRTPWVIAAVVVLVLAIGGVGALIYFNQDEDQPVAGPPTSSSAPTSAPSTQKSTSTSKKPSTSSTPTQVEDILVDSVVTGWQGVLSYKENVAYDVPKDWVVETPGTIVGFEDNNGKPVAVMHGVTTYKEDACTSVKGSYRGHAGFVTAGTTEPERAATNGVKLFADAAALNPDGTTAPVQAEAAKPTKVNAGKVDAFIATAVLTVNQPGECPSPSVLFTAVAFKNGANTALFMMYQDQGVSDALPTESAEKIVQSIRPYQG